jgi:uncharacterized protein (DUF885 family)
VVGGYASPTAAQETIDVTNPPESRTPVFAFADRLVEMEAATDPIEATFNGVDGDPVALTDYSPEGTEARAEQARAARRELATLPLTGDADRMAATLIDERLSARLALSDSGERLRALGVLGSPFQAIRQVFDLMDRSSADDWSVVATRLGGVPKALAGLRVSLEAGLAQGLPAARRQALACAAQADAWSSPDGYFAGLPAAAQAAVAQAAVAGAAGEGAASHEVVRDVAAAVESGARVAGAAYAEMARWLREDYAPHASEIDGVGPERYRHFCRYFNGATPDLEELYAWGWDELHRLESEMAAVADKIVPGGSIEAARAALEADPELVIEGVDALRAWLQDLMDRTIEEVADTHFTIPAAIRRVEAMIAPPGGTAAMYYTPPSEDLRRPGRTWYPTMGKTRFPLWGEPSVAYHEGVPGHHLQVGTVVAAGEQLSRFQRMTFLSSHGEGWALYAERLMDELGYLELPAYRLGYLRTQVMRSVRVVVDIGLHLQLLIPADERFYPGQRWTPELGLAFVLQRSQFPEEFMRSELDRYLGMPAQAISYKLGERSWLAGRAAARAARGSAFDLKAWHDAALRLGPLGLDDLERELALLG